MDKKPMPLLLVEDEVAVCNKFKNYVADKTNVKFVGITGSGPDGIKYVKDCLPEGIILDLELHNGMGSGIIFLQDLKKIGLPKKPIICVTTNVASSIVHNSVRGLGVDVIFCKAQKDYSQAMVINTLLHLRHEWEKEADCEFGEDMDTPEAPAEQRARLSRRIETELNNIGIGLNYKGYSFIKESVLLLLSVEKGDSESVFYAVAENNRTTYNNVIRAVQTAIHKAWNSSAIDDLQKHYTARVDIRTGVPSSTEFVHYYADKIRNSM